MTLLRLEGISKRYGGVRALQDAELSVAPGRIHAVLGENGAGKSTLIKIMAGVVRPDEGRMILDGTPRLFASPAAANQAGIVCVFQELSLIPHLSEGMLAVKGVTRGINYGSDKVRFTNMVRIGKRVRLRQVLLSVEPKSGGVQLKNQCTIEIEGEDRPACVAETISVIYGA